MSSLSIQAINLQASESRISDADIALEMTEFVRNQVLAQSAVAMLGQANAMPQSPGGAFAKSTPALPSSARPPHACDAHSRHDPRIIHPLN